MEAECLDRSIGSKDHAFDSRTYTLYLNGIEKFTATKFDWQEISGMKSKSLRGVISGGRFSHNGWSNLKARPLKLVQIVDILQMLEDLIFTPVIRLG